MKLVESYDRNSCDACDEYEFTFDLTLSDDEDDCPDLRLCKKCLLKLQKLIYER